MMAKRSRLVPAAHLQREALAAEGRTLRQIEELVSGDQRGDAPGEPSGTLSAQAHAAMGRSAEVFSSVQKAMAGLVSGGPYGCVLRRGTPTWGKFPRSPRRRLACALGYPSGCKFRRNCVGAMAPDELSVEHAKPMFIDETAELSGGAAGIAASVRAYPWRRASQ
jgi:hypothetical protein